MSNITPDIKELRLRSPVGRLLFCESLLEPKPRYNASDEDEDAESSEEERLYYSTSLLVPKASCEGNEDWNKMWEAIRKYGVLKLKDADKAFKKNGEPKFNINGLVDGDETSHDSNYDHWVFRFKSPEFLPPGILGEDGEALDEDGVHKMYWGAYACVLFGLYFYDPPEGQNYKSGCNFNLLAVKLLGGGQRLDSGGQAAIGVDEASDHFDGVTAPQIEYDSEDEDEAEEAEEKPKAKRKKRAPYANAKTGGVPF